MLQWPKFSRQFFFQNFGGVLILAEFQKIWWGVNVGEIFQEIGGVLILAKNISKIWWGVNFGEKFHIFGGLLILAIFFNQN